ncbi:MAG: tRNA pseudouridine(55) synthase TruB [Bacilli bacterium]
MNGVIIINKDKGRTSRDIVNDLVHIFNTKKIGHTGTLDPIATGVLVVCIGSCTKLVDILTSKEKEYIATIKLGIKTDTGDITGNIISEKKYDVNKKIVEETLHSFLGISLQTVPIYSAVKVNGKKLYEYARNNETIELPKREIVISSIKLLELVDGEIKFQVTVSKGTYIRSLIEDICTKLNTVGTMSSLIRTKQANFSINKAVTIDDVRKGNYHIISKEELLANYETINIDKDLYEKIKCGALILKEFTSNYCVFKYNDKIVAIYQEYTKDPSLAKPYKMFV